MEKQSPIQEVGGSKFHALVGCNPYARELPCQQSNDLEIVSFLTAPN